MVAMLGRSGQRHAEGMGVKQCLHGAGLTNDFLVTSHAEAALTYNDSSVNENMHSAMAFRILLKPQNNFLSHLPDSHFRFFRRTVIAIVLSTDMAGHTDLVNVRSSYTLKSTC